MSRDPINQEPETHESYGVVGFSRITVGGGGQALFGSSIKHSHLIALRISTAKKYRDCQSDRFSSDQQLIEIHLSPTQFAEAITSFNVGDGVPCTIQRVIGDKLDEKTRRFREECPEINFRKQANNELKEEMSELGSRLEKLSEDAEKILNSKGTIKKADKEKLLSDLRSVKQEVNSNIPFVHECFDRSVSKTVTEAKGEIDASYQHMREKLGDKVLAGEVTIPMLEEGDKDGNRNDN